jgi:hypothetical protein
VEGFPIPYLTASVGRSGANRPHDVATIQATPRRALDRERAQALDIEVPSEPLAQRLIGAGIQLVQNMTATANDADPDLPTGEAAEAELADICEALQGEFPNIAERLENLRQQLREPLEQHRETVERLVRAGVAGWAEDVRGWFAGNGNRAILVQADTGVPIFEGPGGRYFHQLKTATPVVAFPMTEFIDHLESAEGIVNHMYLDSARPPNVTIGIGINLTAAGEADAAVDLLLGHATVRATGADATEQEIRDDYAAVAARPAGNFSAAHYEQFTALDIDDATARQFAEDFVRRALAALVAGDDFPEFDRTPANAQKGLMDLLYAGGPNGFTTRFPRFSSAYNGRDWKTCSRQVFRESVSNTRDNAVSRWFQHR